MVGLVFLSLLFVAQWIMMGFKEAILYSRYGAEATRYNEHVLFTFERACICFIAFVSVFVDLKIMACVLIAQPFVFSFIHNTAYNYGRHYIRRANNYPSTFSWSYVSPTSTAVIQFSFAQRIILAIIGVLLSTVIYHLLNVSPT